MAVVLGLSLPRAVVLTIVLAASRVTAQQAPLPAAQQEFLDRVAELAKSAPRPEPVGNHVIRGRVVTATGEPVAGVRIRVTTTKDLYGPFDRRAFSEENYWEPDLARSMSATVKAWWKRAARSRDATTAADGTFVLDHLDDGAFDVRASRDGFSIEPSCGGPGRGAVVACDSTVAFVAFPTHRRIFDLRLPDGSQPERATLDLKRFGEMNRYEQGTWTPADPAVDLPAGDWVVTAASGGDASRYRSIQNSSYLSKETAVVSPPPDGSDTVRIALRGVCAIEGKIVPPHGLPNASFGVRAVRLEAGQPPDAERFLEQYRKGSYSEPRAQVQWTREGELDYRFDRLEPGRWCVGVFRWQTAAPLIVVALDVGEKVVEQDFVVPPDVASRDPRVRVFDPAGAPLRDCSFRYLSYDVGPDGVIRAGSSNWLSVLRTGDGAFAYPSVEPGARFFLFADHPRFGTCSGEVPADARESEMRFVAPIAVAMKIPGLAERARGRRVELEWSQFIAGTSDRISKRLDADLIAADDTVDVGPLQPGRYLLSISVEPVKASGYPALEIVCGTWDVTAETKTLELPFPKLALLRVNFAAKTRGTCSLEPVERSCSSGRSGQSADIDPDGGVTFVDVVPGTYAVRGPGTESMLVEAPASRPITFVAEEVKVLRVVVRDREGALGKAGLATGDRIVAIDGREFSGRQQLDFIRQTLQGKEVTLTVQRGDQRFEVVVSRRLLVGGPTADGTLYEAAR